MKKFWRWLRLEIAIFHVTRIETTMRAEADNLYRVQPGDRYFP